MKRCSTVPHSGCSDYCAAFTTVAEDESPLDTTKIVPCMTELQHAQVRTLTRFLTCLYLFGGGGRGFPESDPVLADTSANPFFGQSLEKKERKMDVCHQRWVNVRALQSYYLQNLITHVNVY